MRGVVGARFWSFGFLARACLGEESSVVSILGRVDCLGCVGLRWVLCVDGLGLGLSGFR